VTHKICLFRIADTPVIVLLAGCLSDKPQAMKLMEDSHHTVIASAAGECDGADVHRLHLVLSYTQIVMAKQVIPGSIDFW